MKMRLTESELNKIVYEGTKRALMEVRMDNLISKALRESIADYGVMEDFEPKSDEETGASVKKRQKVIQFLSSPTVDVAQYAYKLWPDKDEDSCRSYFYKCLNGEKDDNGNEYKFTNSEVNSLYSLISNVQSV